MNREQVVLEGRDGTSKATLQAPHLADPSSQPTSKYLTSRQLADYLGFGGKTPQCSANKFIQRNGLRRYWRSSVVALVLRADVDRVLEGKARRDAHAVQAAATGGRNAT
ncbi:MAG: hypothetical protein IT181_12970 [Acidobacteria bacterium]|nr:hypothetical protein [Acidobacteriota bacterium]